MRRDRPRTPTESERPAIHAHLLRPPAEQEKALACLKSRHPGQYDARCCI